MSTEVKDLNILINDFVVGKPGYIAPEMKDRKGYNSKVDIYVLGCIIYELFTLNIYTKDKIMNEIKEISSDIYNKIWQILIDSLLQIDYKKRFDINQVIKFLEDELNNKDSMENLGNKMNRMNFNNKNNIIIIS